MVIYIFVSSEYYTYRHAAYGMHGLEFSTHAIERSRADSYGPLPTEALHIPICGPSKRCYPTYYELCILFSE